MSEHTAMHGSCGCSVTLRKTCDCSNAAQVDVVQCPMHEAALELLAALEGLIPVADSLARAVEQEFGEKSCTEEYRAIDKARDAIKKAKLPA